MDVKDLAVMIRESQKAAKRILGSGYEEKVSIFRDTLECVAESQAVTLLDAAILAAVELEKQGHNTILIYAALCDLVDAQSDAKQVQS